jgi:hypothetical protein
MRFRKRDWKPCVIESRFEVMLLQPSAESWAAALYTHGVHQPPSASSSSGRECSNRLQVSNPICNKPKSKPNTIPSPAARPADQQHPLHVPGAWVGDVAQPEGCVSLLNPPMQCIVAMPLTVRLLCGRRTLKGSLTARFPVAQSAGLRPWTSLRSPHGARPYGVEVPDLPVCV